MVRLSALLTLTLVLAVAVRAQDAAPAADPRPALLRQLDGEWLMTGDVQGEPVTYTLVAGPTLRARFSELHMRDAAQPPQYEARVFVGYDAESDVVIAHWMDDSGARFSVPHGTGRIDGNVMQFTIPYATGPFRDTFEYDPGRGTWQMRIEAGQPDGSWAHFARYEILRK